MNDFVYEEEVGFRYFEDPLDEIFSKYDTDISLRNLNKISY